MEIMHYRVEYSQETMYVFSEQHIVRFKDDGLGICHVAPWYKDLKTQTHPNQGPYITITVLPLQFYHYSTYVS